MINDTAKKWIIVLGISVVVLLGIIVYGIHYMRNSELFLGKRCMDIYISDYVTEKEKKEMQKDCYWIAFYPKKYQDSPQALRERIRKNKVLLMTENSNLILRRVSLRRYLSLDLNINVS